MNKPVKYGLIVTGGNIILSVFWLRFDIDVWWPFYVLLAEVILAIVFSLIESKKDLGMGFMIGIGLTFLIGLGVCGYIIANWGH